MWIRSGGKDKNGVSGMTPGDLPRAWTTQRRSSRLRLGRVWKIKDLVLDKLLLSCL